MFVCLKSHHANTFGIEHTILIAGDKIGILSITMVKYDEIFHNNFHICVEEMYKEGLEWSYEPSVPIPMDLIASGVEKWWMKISTLTVEVTKKPLQYVTHMTYIV